MADNPFQTEIDRRQGNPFTAEMQRRGQGSVPFGVVPSGTKAGPFGTAPTPNPRAFEQALELADPALQGLTFGFGDEITSAVSGVPIEEVRARSERIREEQPGAALAAEIGGGLATGAGAARLAQGVATSLPNLVRFGLGGAAAGGVAGAGTAEGGIEERAQGAVEGAAIGAGLGVTLPLAGRAAAAAITPLLNRVQGPTRQAIERIRNALQRDDMTVQDARDELERLGVNATIADAGGENVRSLAQTVQSRPGQARNLGRDVLEARQEGQTARIAESINEALGPGTEFRQTRDALIQSRATQASPLYDAAYAAEIPNSVELQAILGRPAVQDAWRRAQRIARNEGAELPDELDPSVAPSMQVLDFIKRGLDDKIETSRDPITGRLVGEEARSFATARRELLDLIDQLNPDYKAARAVFAGESASIDALQQGRRLGNSLARRGEQFDPEQIMDDLGRMSDAEKAFFRQGLARGLTDVIEASPDTANAVRLLIGTEARRGRLRAAFPDAETFTRFMSDLSAETRFFQTRQAVLGGSPTQQRLAAQADLESPLPERNFLEGGLTSAVGRGISSLARAATRPSQATVDELGTILFSQGPEATRLINLIGQTPAIPPQLQRGSLAALVEAERQGGSFPNR